MTFRGAISELPNISIDRFDYYNGINNLTSTCFFLSHAHADHTQGLEQRTFLQLLANNSCYYLYCSPVTHSILIEEFSLREEQIKELTDATVITVPGNESQPSSYNVLVTPIPVEHCPGAVMFLFETSQKSILYTGDFRITIGDTMHYDQLFKYYIQEAVLDKIYFDSTFLHEDYWSFPSTTESLNKITSLTKKFLKEDPKTYIVIKIPAKYGYEKVMAKLAREHDCKIYVPHNLFLILHQVLRMSILTNNPYSTKIHVYPQYSEVLAPKPYKKIWLAAKCFRHGIDRLVQDMVKESSTGTKLCYATHCSCSEILDFLIRLNPTSAVANHPHVGETNRERTQDYISNIMMRLRSLIHSDTYESLSDSVMHRYFSLRRSFPVAVVSRNEEVLKKNKDKNFL